MDEKALLEWKEAHADVYSKFKQDLEEQLLKLWKYLDREDITPEMKQQKDAIEAIYKELQQKRKHADITDLSVAINEIVNEHIEIDSEATQDGCRLSVREGIVDWHSIRFQN